MTTASASVYPFECFVEEFKHTGDRTLRVLLNFCKRRAQPNGDIWSKSSYPIIRERVREGFPIVAPDGVMIGVVSSCSDLVANEFEIVVEINDESFWRQRGYVKCAFWGDVVHRHAQGERHSLTIRPLEMVLWKQEYMR